MKIITDYCYKCKDMTAHIVAGCFRSGGCLECNRREYERFREYERLKAEAEKTTSKKSVFP